MVFRLGKRIHLEVWYDSWCPLCTGIRKRLIAIDSFRVLQFQSIRDEIAVSQSSVKHIPLPELEQRMHVREVQSNRLYSGIDAVIVISKVIPLLWIFWPLLVISRWIGLGERMYDFIASRRIIVPAGACQDQQCDWRPPASNKDSK
ncbi:DUF393 domain-containing protein [Paenibacillus sp. UMB4589-SE434]|uniref:thiol-disulfide oxidoreductase DCC family protein n=1 Tax=Paenibacillus sp. UMB4589-SE434 TaxID=3046314 RepID=UPI00254ECC22|nr:DUF393 domain-containing protein [Paenibacillus sp. UMB4589-SE434]MDK8180013.1 DUF393 domain-containing protein [Paenibacillus sp. UMB4589-SE434]